MPPPDGDPHREALIVAADSYEDPKLGALRAPARDAEELARVLGDPEIGAFQVGISLNEPDHVVRRRLSEFFRNRSTDDLLLLHISGHGLKDEDGALYFASSNTSVEDLEATALPSEFVNRQMTRSRSRRIVLLLDCCFGGAFARGMVHRAGEEVAVKDEFDGQGRVVLTASRAMEYAFEGDRLEGDARPSVFTSAIVEALETGRADRDQDRRISVDELYDYVYERVRDETPSQTPSKWTFDVHGDLYVARSSWLAEVDPTELPQELRAAMESPFATIRAGAVEELARLAGGSDPPVAAAARAALETLAADDSRRVSEAAAEALGVQSEPPSLAVPAALPAAPTPTPDRPRPESRRASTTSSSLAIRAARAAAWKNPIAVGGAVLLLLAYFRDASWDSSWAFALDVTESIWAIWSPVEAFGLAALVVAAVALARRGRVRREVAEGIYLGAGGAAVAGAVAFAGPYELIGGGFFLTFLGGLCLLAAGALGLITHRAADVALPRRTGVLAGTGVLLGLSPLIVNVEAETNTSLIGFYELAFYLEVLLVGLAAAGAALALVLAPRVRLHAAGALIALGFALAAHMLGVLVHFGHEDGVRYLRFGGPLGLVGGLLLVAAGVTLLRGDRKTAAAPRTAPAAS